METRFSRIIECSCYKYDGDNYCAHQILQCNGDIISQMNFRRIIKWMRKRKYFPFSSHFASHFFTHFLSRLFIYYIDIKLCVLFGLSETKKIVGVLYVMQKRLAELIFVRSLSASGNFREFTHLQISMREMKARDPPFLQFFKHSSKH